jgi:hypothetical protein
MWITITTGVNNFFSGVSKDRDLRRSNGLKMAFLSLSIKLVETLKTMVYNYLNSFNSRKKWADPQNQIPDISKGH